MKKMVISIARGLMSLIFLFAGGRLVMDWDGAISLLSMTFAQWSIHLEGIFSQAEMNKFFIEHTDFFLKGAVFLELVGGFLLLVGYKVRLGAFFLLLFLIPVTVIFHPFWFAIGEEMHQELIIFMKHLAFIGALLYLLMVPDWRKG